MRSRSQSAKIIKSEDDIESGDEPVKQAEKDEGTSGGTKKVLMTPMNKRQIILIETKLVENGTSHVEVITLPHPGTYSKAKFLLNRKLCELRELRNFEESHRSWIIDNESVETKGNLLMASKIDPILIILPYLKSCQRRQPLEQLLAIKDYPHLSYLVECTKNMKKIADCRGPADLNVWEYNAEKAINYLCKKVEKLAEALIKMNVNIEGHSTSGTFVKTLNKDVDKDAFNKFALGVLAEYMEEDLEKEVAKKLNLPEKKKEKTSEKNQKKRLPDEEIASDKIKTSKSNKAEPDEDYSKAYKSLALSKSPGNLNSKQKALAKSAGGSKCITSFFTKNKK